MSFCYKRKRGCVIFFVIATMVLSVSAFAQQTCLFFSEGDVIPDPRDEILIAALQMKYDVTVEDSKNLRDGNIDIENIKGFDFTFVSESIGSTRAKNLRGAPVPIFTTELYTSKWDIMGWVPINSEDYYGTTLEGETVVTIFEGDHFLAAGFATGTEIEIVSGTTTEDADKNYLTFSVPGIDFINIAALSNDPTKTIVMGVEAGTVLYNAEDVIDGSVVSENRVAAVGIHADANAFITEDAFKLIDAGIRWILGDTSTAVEHKNCGLTPDKFSLDQNYPNPFNPLTTIDFTLVKSCHTTLTIYNVMGQPVKKLVHGYMTNGRHSITLNGEDLDSGVYFYRISSGQFTSMKKAILLK